jgi:hypothetical protein
VYVLDAGATELPSSPIAGTVQSMASLPPTPRIRQPIGGTRSPRDPRVSSPTHSGSPTRSALLHQPRRPHPHPPAWPTNCGAGSVTWPWRLQLHASQQTLGLAPHRSWPMPSGSRTALLCRATVSRGTEPHCTPQDPRGTLPRRPVTVMQGLHSTSVQPALTQRVLERSRLRSSRHTVREPQSVRLAGPWRWGSS